MCNFPLGCLVRQSNPIFIIFLSFQTSPCNTTTSCAAVWWSLPCSVWRRRQPRGDSWPSLNDKQCQIIYTDSRQISLSVMNHSVRNYIWIPQWDSLESRNANFRLCSVQYSCRLIKITQETGNSLKERWRMTATVQMSDIIFIKLNSHFSFVII